MPATAVYYCPECGSMWGPPPGPCRTCFEHTVLELPVGRDGILGTAAPGRPRRRPTAELARFLDATETPRLLRWGYRALRLPRRVAVLLTGRPGSGKSTLATTLAVARAAAGAKVLWIPAEEGASPTTARRFQQVLRRVPIQRPEAAPVLVSDARTLRDAQEEIERFERSGGDLVVVDSLTVLRAGTGWWEDLCHADLGVIGVAHLNARGSPMGGQRVAYDPDVHVVVDSFEAHLIKSRWFDEHAPTRWPVDDVELMTAPAATVVPFPVRRSE